MGEESREAPEQVARGLGFLRPQEQVPEVPVLSREHLQQLENIQEVSPPCEMRPISAEAS